MKKYEYSIVTFEVTAEPEDLKHDFDIENELDKYGADGWECFQMQPVGPNRMKMFLKREKGEVNGTR